MHPRILPSLAIAGALLGLLYAPFHAAAYLATDSGEEPPIVPWVGPFRDAVGPALTFGTPDEVYLAYGKVLPFVLAGLLCGLVALHRRQRAPERRLERIGFRVALAGSALLLLGAVTEYYTPFLDEGFLFLSAPGMLGSLVGYVLYGLATVKAGVVGRGWGWTLVAAMPAVLPLVALFGHIPLALALLEVAWIGIGARLLRAPVGARGQDAAVPHAG